MTLFIRLITVLAWMHALTPDQDVGALAFAVAIVADDDVEASELTAIAFRESGLRNRAIGNGSVCAMQVQGGSSELLDDPLECVSEGATILRASKRVDPVHPIAFYAAGWNFRGDTARRISQDRMWIAARLRRGELTAASVPR